MKERPILFSGPMVRAIIAGEKTQTRRALRRQPPEDPSGRWTFIACSTDKRSVGGFSYSGVSATGPRYTDRGREVEHLRLRCPYGRPGERLWVRERARLIETDEGFPFVSGVRDDARVKVRYEADGAESPWVPYPSRLAFLHVGRCIPNGCYREASRITLEVTDVRVERLQAISEDDALAEGVGLTEWNGHPEWPRTAGFAELWDSLAKPGAKWMDDPWVWVVGFKRVAEARR